jgi:hypothetical protein
MNHLLAIRSRQSLPWVPLLIVGASLGAASLTLEHAPRPWDDFSYVGGPWLLAAFLAGLIARRLLLGTVAGIATLAWATAIYYLGKSIVGSSLNPLEYDTPGFWFLVAVMAGGLFGFLGALWASGPSWARVGALATVSGTLLFEAFSRTDSAVIMGALIVVALALPLTALNGHAERAFGLGASIAMMWIVREGVELASHLLLGLR